MITVHLPNGFSSVRLLAVTPKGAQFGPVGYELNLLYVAGLLTLAIGGAGTCSYDRYIVQAKQARKRAGAAPK
jgi:putative oxidoreductase